MIKFLIILMATGFQLLAGAAVASQSAELACVKKVNMALKSIKTNACDTYELHVKITTDSDAGKFGAFGIFAELPKNRLLYWKNSEGWRPYTKNMLVQPVDVPFKALPASSDYVVYRGDMKGLCQLSSGESFKLYAGHATLKSDHIEDVRLFLSKFGINGVHALNFWNMALLNDAIDGKKGGLVFSHDCS